MLAPFGSSRLIISTASRSGPQEEPQATKVSPAPSGPWSCGAGRSPRARSSFFIRFSIIRRRNWGSSVIWPSSVCSFPGAM